MQSQFDRKVNQLREMENGFCNPMKNKVAEELREELREDLERRGFDKDDIRQIESEWCPHDHHRARAGEPLTNPGKTGKHTAFATPQTGQDTCQDALTIPTI